MIRELTGCVETADNPRPSPAAGLLRPTVALRPSTQLQCDGAPRGAAPGGKGGGMYREKKSGTWIVQWIDHDRIRRTKRCPSKEMAKAFRRRKADESFALRHGLISLEQLRSAERQDVAIAPALESFKAHLNAHVKIDAIRKEHGYELHRCAKAGCELMGLVVVGQISPTLIREMELRLFKAGKSTSTVSHLAQAMMELRRFTIEGAKPGRQRTHAKFIKGTLEPEQMQSLIETSPVDRADVYLLGVFTGIRGKELARLLWSNFDVTKGCFRLLAKQTKTKRDQVIPLMPLVVDRLKSRQERLGKVGNVRIFQTMPTRDTWVDDLTNAGIDHKTDEAAGGGGRLFTRSSQRGTFTNWMILAGVPRDAQLRLRRDVGGVIEEHYTDFERLLESDRGHLKRVQRWYEKALEQGRKVRHA